MTFRIGTHRPLECSCPLWGLRRPACTYRLSPEPTYADVHPPGGVWAAAPTCRSRGLGFEGLTRMFKGLRANDTPRQTPLCPKRRPPRPQPPVFSVFRRGGLHFGLHTTSNRDLAATKGGENGVIRDPTRRRHAGSQLLMLQTPSITSMEAIPKPAGPVRSARGRRNPGNSEQGRCHGETKLARTSRTAPLPVQNSPSTCRTPPVPVHN